MKNSKYSSNMPIPRRRSELPIRPQSDNGKQGISAVIRSSLFGLLSAIATTAILTTVACVAAYSSSDPTVLTLPLSIAVLLISNLVGGIVTSKLTNGSPLMCGLVCGTAITAAMLIASLMLFNATATDRTFFESAFLHVSAVCFCILGAFIGDIKLKRDPRRKRFGQ